MVVADSQADTLYLLGAEPSIASVYSASTTGSSARDAHCSLCLSNTSPFSLSLSFPLPLSLSLSLSYISNLIMSI